MSTPPVEPAADPDAPPDWAEAYPELKRLARARLRAAGTLTHLNTTALVNESFMKWGQRAAPGDFPSRGHFFAYAARVMRSIIVDEVRQRQSQRRGGGWQAVTLDTALGEQLPDPNPGDDEALKVDEALAALQALEPRLARVVEMRYFAGMTETEIAQVLGLTDRTVRRDWDKARALLRRMLED